MEQKNRGIRRERGTGKYKVIEKAEGICKIMQKKQSDSLKISGQQGKPCI